MNHRLTTPYSCTREELKGRQAPAYLAGQYSFLSRPCSITFSQNWGNLFSWSARWSRSRATLGSRCSFLTEAAAIFNTSTSLRRVMGAQGTPTYKGQGVQGQAVHLGMVRCSPDHHLAPSYLGMFSVENRSTDPISFLSFAGIFCRAKMKSARYSGELSTEFISPVRIFGMISCRVAIGAWTEKQTEQGGSQSTLRVSLCGERLLGLVYLPSLQVRWTSNNSYLAR